MSIFIIPPIIVSSAVAYQNINNDQNLRELQTKYFNKKVIEWITNDSDYKNLKNLLSFFKNENGNKVIYNLLRKYVKKNDINWYDLKKENIQLKIILNINYLRRNKTADLLLIGSLFTISVSSTLSLSPSDEKSS